MIDLTVLDFFFVFGWVRVCVCMRVCQRADGCRRGCKICRSSSHPQIPSPLSLSDSLRDEKDPYAPLLILCSILQVLELF